MTTAEGQASQPQEGGGDPGGGPEPKGGSVDATPAITGLHLLGLLIIVGGIVLVLLIVMPKFDATKETASGVLGIVIPAFATIGAALFGITVGYTGGSATGKAKGKAEGRKEVAKQVRDRVTKTEPAHQNLVEPLKLQLEARDRESVFLLPDESGQGQAYNIKFDDLAAADSLESDLQTMASRILGE